MILADSQWFLNKSKIDSCWFSNKSETDSHWFAFILSDSWWFLPILGDSQISLKLILNDSQISLNNDSHWFSLIVDDSCQFSMILTEWVLVMSTMAMLTSFCNMTLNHLIQWTRSYFWIFAFLASYLEYSCSASPKKTMQDLWCMLRSSFCGIIQLSVFCPCKINFKNCDSDQVIWFRALKVFFRWFGNRTSEAKSGDSV